MPGIKPLNRYPKKKEANRYMVKGFMAQFIKRVIATGFGVFAALHLLYEEHIYFIIFYISPPLIREGLYIFNRESLIN